MNQTRATSAYARVHYAARKALGPACERCGATRRLEAALNPETPAERLVLDANINSLYSERASDYMTLCVPCHRALDFVELRTHCRRGHEYAPGNTSVKADGSRRCLACHRENEARRLADPAKRLAKNAADRAYRTRRPMTPEQKARKVALQRLRRRRSR